MKKSMYNTNKYKVEFSSDYIKVIAHYDSHYFVFDAKQYTFYIKDKFIVIVEKKLEFKNRDYV